MPPLVRGLEKNSETVTIKNLTLPIIFLVFFGRMEAQDLSEKANAFLETLSKELRKKTVFSFEEEERFNMNYIPMPRLGPTFHDFNQNQKNAALELLKGSLSLEGYQKTVQIMELEKVLRVLEDDDNDKMPDGRPRRDSQNYHFCVFGTPSSNAVWGWRFEGHHVSLNFTSDSGTIVSATPTFFGSNPAIVKTGEQLGMQVLKKESVLGLRLVNSLTTHQLKTARFSKYAPQEIITANHRKAVGVDKKGILFSQLTDNQKKLFMQLLEVYIGNYIFDFSENLRNKINAAGIENLSFAWAGQLTEGKPYYYRIHGPMLLIEFDNIQNNANHIHTAVRDLTNDFAEDFLKQHYQKEH